MQIKSFLDNIFFQKKLRNPCVPYSITVETFGRLIHLTLVPLYSSHSISLEGHFVDPTRVATDTTGYLMEESRRPIPRKRLKGLH